MDKGGDHRSPESVNFGDRGSGNCDPCCRKQNPREKLKNSRLPCGVVLHCFFSVFRLKAAKHAILD